MVKWLGGGLDDDTYTELSSIKLTLFPAIFRFLCGSDKLQFCRYFTMFNDF